MKRKFLGILATILMICCASFAVSPVWATDEIDVDVPATGDCSDGSGFLGLKPWYDGYCSGGEIPEINDEKELITFVWVVILNISYDISLVAGYIAIGMVVYSGYLYIMSQGDPGKMTSAKKSLMAAIIGMIITMGASVIVNTFKTVLAISGGGWQQGDVAAARVQDAFTWAYSMAGIVAVVFIIKNGIDYMLSAGEPGKTQKATRGLIFSAVGLVIVIFAAVITSFVAGTVSGAM